jgi:shikimate dehydrogenase
LDRYVVIGNPVGHSKSPLIHSHFARQTGQAVQYDALLAQVGEFCKTAENFFAEGGKGANVTVPFKQDAYEWVAQLSPEAQTAGAVNTLYLDSQQKICGHNTDGIGLIKDILNNHDGSLRGKNILLLGAGGASRGILQPLLKQFPAQICIANRTVRKAEELADTFKEQANAGEETGAITVTGCGFNDLGSDSFDWIINATSASLQGEIPPLSAGLLNADTWCYDLMYSDEPTLFCQWSEESGARKTMDGLGMLVEQAAESFQTWRGVRPQTKDLIALLRRT